MDDIFISDMIQLLNVNKDIIPYILAAIFSMFIIAYLIPRFIFYMYIMNTPDVIQKFIYSIIYKLDELADELSNREKRNKAVDSIHSILLYKGIIVPRFICGWIIDFEVQYIRNLQRNCPKDSDLHKINNL